MLTPLQAELLARAWVLGYYAVPRCVTLTRMARQSGRSPPALGKILRLGRGTASRPLALRGGHGRGGRGPAHPDATRTVKTPRHSPPGGPPGSDRRGRTAGGCPERPDSRTSDPRFGVPRPLRRRGGGARGRPGQPRPDRAEGPVPVGHVSRGTAPERSQHEGRPDGQRSRVPSTTTIRERSRYRSRTSSREATGSRPGTGSPSSAWSRTCRSGSKKERSLPRRRGRAVSGAPVGNLPPRRSFSRTP